MKLALVVPGGVDPGGERRVVPCLLALIERLARDHEVHVFALFQPDAPLRYTLRGATIHHIGRPRTAFRALRRIWREHRRRRFDVAWAMMGSPAGVFATHAGRLLGVPSIVHFAGGELVALPDIAYGEQLTSRGRRRIRTVLDRATRVTAQSQPMVDTAAAMGRTVIRLPLSVDLREWPPCPPRRREPDRPARLIHVATSSPVKDPATLMAAAARLAADGVDFVLDVVGEDLQGGRIARDVAAHGLAERARLHGFLTQRQLRPLLRSADLLVHASRHEGAPIVLLEAAASGVPAAGTATGTFVEWAPGAAATAPPADPGALAAAIRSLLDDDERRLRLAELAQRRVIAEDADWTASSLVRLAGEIASE